MFVVTIETLHDAQKLAKSGVPSMYLYFGYHWWYLLLVFGILVTLVVWFSFSFFCLAHLALQNVNKGYVIFLYFRNFVNKSGQKPKTKNGMNETKVWLLSHQKVWYFHLKLIIWLLGSVLFPSNQTGILEFKSTF